MSVSSSSVMLSSLQRDSSMQHSLVPFLSIADVGALHASCHTCRRALDEPTGTASVHDRETVSVCVYTHLDILLRSRWVLPLISALAVCLHPNGDVSLPKLPEPVVVTGLSPEDGRMKRPLAYMSASAQQWAWRKLLQSLPSFTSLRSLKVSFIECDQIVLDREALLACFGVLGRRLRCLHLCSPRLGAVQTSAQPTLSVLGVIIPCLPHLDTLDVDDSQSWHSDFDPALYTALPSLTRLATHSWTESDVPFAAYDALARCSNLTDLRFSFRESLIRARENRDVQWPERNKMRKKHYQATLGLLISTRVPLQEQGAVQLLRVIRLEDVEMTEDMFVVLSRLPSLTELHPSHWDTQSPLRAGSRVLLACPIWSSCGSEATSTSDSRSRIRSRRSPRYDNAEDSNDWS